MGSTTTLTNITGYFKWRIEVYKHLLVIGCNGIIDNTDPEPFTTTIVRDKRAGSVEPTTKEGVFGAQDGSSYHAISESGPWSWWCSCIPAIDWIVGEAVEIDCCQIQVPTRTHNSVTMSRGDVSATSDRNAQSGGE